MIMIMKMGVNRRTERKDRPTSADSMQRRFKTHDGVIVVWILRCQQSILVVRVVVWIFEASVWIECLAGGTDAKVEGLVGWVFGVFEV
jgi:hypothetical protein